MRRRLCGLLIGVPLVVLAAALPGRAAPPRAQTSPSASDLRTALLAAQDARIETAAQREAVAAGADVLVAGTASFTGGQPAYAGNIRRLRGG